MKTLHRPVGECCQRFLHCLQRAGGGGGRSSRVPQWELLQRLTALQPTVAQLLSAARPDTAAAAVFTLSFPSLFAVACVAGNRRALVTLAELLRHDVSRFVSTAFHKETLAQGGGAFVSVEAAKAFINDHSDLIDPYVDVLSQCRGGDPICEPLLRLLFLESIYDCAIALLSGSAASAVLDCVFVAVARVCASLRADDLRAVCVALRQPFRHQVLSDSDLCPAVDAQSPVSQANETLVACYDTHGFHQLVRQRLVPQIDDTLRRCGGQTPVAAPLSGPPTDNLVSTTIHFLLGNEGAAISATQNAMAAVTDAVALLQQEESFLRRRLATSVWASYTAFLESSMFWDALQQLYLALRIEGYRRALPHFVIQQKDMSYTLVCAHMLRVCTAFREQQRRLSIEAGEQMRLSQDKLMCDEKCARTLLEETAVDELQRLYLSALYPGSHAAVRGQRDSHAQPHTGDYVAEAGSAIFGAFSKLQKRLVDTVAPAPKHTTAVLPTPVQTQPVAMSADDGDGWGWAPDEDDFLVPDKAAMPGGAPTFPQRDDDWNWPETPVESTLNADSHPMDQGVPQVVPADPNASVPPQAPPQEEAQWGWSSESHGDEADDTWDWPTETQQVPQPLRDHAPVVSSGAGMGDGWDWPSEPASPTAVNDGALNPLPLADGFDADQEVRTAQQQRQLFLANVL